jgi:hypothetical protein
MGQGRAMRFGIASSNGRGSRRFATRGAIVVLSSSVLVAPGSNGNLAAASNYTHFMIVMIVKLVGLCLAAWFAIGLLAAFVARGSVGVRGEVIDRDALSAGLHASPHARPAPNTFDFRPLPRERRARSTHRTAPTDRAGAVDVDYATG